MKDELKKLTVLSRIQIQVRASLNLVKLAILMCALDWSRQEQVDLIKYLIKDDVLNTKHCKKYLEELEEKSETFKRRSTAQIRLRLIKLSCT
jgi:hypothetical protein